MAIEFYKISYGLSMCFGSVHTNKSFFPHLVIMFLARSNLNLQTNMIAHLFSSSSKMKILNMMLIFTSFNLYAAL